MASSVDAKEHDSLLPHTSKGRATNIDEINVNSNANVKRLTRFAIILLMCISMFVAWTVASDPQKSVTVHPLLLNSMLKEMESAKLKHPSSLTEGNDEVKLDRPHIIFVLIDDQGYADMGYNAEPGSMMKHMMPHTDEAAANGLKFSNYYAEHLCTPARATLLTGKHPIHSGMQYKVCSEMNPFGLPRAHKVMPEYLQEMGYQTHMVGKWHLGFFNFNYQPRERGFDSFYGYYAGSEEYYTHEVFDSGEAFKDFHMDNDALDDDGFSLALYENQVTHIIDTHNTSQPLFLYYATQAIHAPYSKPPSFMLSGTQETLANAVEDVKEDRGLLLKTAAAFDHSFEKLVNDLKRNDMYDNSWILVASDNGACSATGGNNYPLRGQKNSLFEGGIRTNAFIHSPLLPENLKGATNNCLFHKVDWLSTILNGILGGQADLAQTDSLNQLETIMGGECIRNDMIHNLEMDVTGLKDTLRVAIRSENYKFIYGEDDDGWFSETDYSSDSEACDVEDNVFGEDGYIFDISKDPTEYNNLYDDVSDNLLNELWSKVDELFHGQAEPAYKTADDKCLFTWTNNERFLTPWVNDEDLSEDDRSWKEGHTQLDFDEDVDTSTDV